VPVVGEPVVGEPVVGAGADVVVSWAVSVAAVEEEAKTCSSPPEHAVEGMRTSPPRIAALRTSIFRVTSSNRDWLEVEFFGRATPSGRAHLAYFRETFFDLDIPVAFLIAGAARLKPQLVCVGANRTASA
jgi:hypothetical protein